jgi:hypothetical protein
MRIKFKKGRQRKFIQKVLLNLHSPSLRALKQYGISTKYQTLKSYFSENRTLPKDFFDNLCELSGIDEKEIKFELLDDNWGNVKGGKK